MKAQRYLLFNTLLLIAFLTFSLMEKKRIVIITVNSCYFVLFLTLFNVTIKVIIRLIIPNRTKHGNYYGLS